MNITKQFTEESLIHNHSKHFREISNREIIDEYETLLLFSLADVMKEDYYFNYVATLVYKMQNN